MHGKSQRKKNPLLSRSQKSRRNPKRTGKSRTSRRRNRDHRNPTDSNRTATARSMISPLNNVTTRNQRIALEAHTQNLHSSRTAHNNSSTVSRQTNAQRISVM